MRWLTLAEVAEHMLEIPASTARTRRAAGQLDDLVTKRVGAHLRYHPEAAWFFACHGRAATSLEEAYAWAEIHPLPEVPTKGARLVTRDAGSASGPGR